MKNNTLFIIIAGCITLFSCGTANRASYSSSDFINGIYYVPQQEESDNYALYNSELNNLSTETEQYFNNRSKGIKYTASQTAQTARNLQNTQNIQNSQAAIIADSLFDPTYDINVILGYVHPEWDLWYQPAWSTYQNAWHNPYWGLHYQVWAPFGSWNRWHGWYGWYGWYGWHWGYGGWYGNMFYGWHHPWWDFPPYYGPGPGPGYYPPFHDHKHRDVYYGQRTSTPSYNNKIASNNKRGASYTRKEPAVNQIRGNRNNSATNLNSVVGTQSKPHYNNSTTAYRRGESEMHNGAMYNNNAANAGSNNKYSSNSVKLSDNKSTNPNGNDRGSMYRRSATQYRNVSPAKNSSGNSYYKNSNSYSSGSSYSRSSSSSYSRNSSSYSNSGSTRSSNSQSMSSGSSRSSSSSSSGGSAYRR